MNENEIKQVLDRLEGKIDTIGESVRKIRRQLLFRAILSFVLFVLPIIAIVFSIPFLMDVLRTYEDLLVR
jgi:hypothetical protein